MSAARRQPRYNKGRWEVQRERLHLAPGPRPGMDRAAVPIGDLVPKVFAGSELEEPFWQQQLVDAWEQIVGPQVAAHTRPGPVHGHTLVIYVDSAAWLSEIQRFAQGKILANLEQQLENKRFRSLRFQLDPEGTRRYRK